MSLPYRFEPEAEDELYEATARYEAEREGLGRVFLARAEQVTAFIRQFPEAGALASGCPTDLGVRQVRLRRYPYRVVYLKADELIVIIAVAHERRRPRYWEDRLPPG